MGSRMSWPFTFPCSFSSLLFHYEWGIFLGLHNSLLSHTHSLSLTETHTLTHPHTPSHSQTFSLSLSLSETLCHSLSFSSFPLPPLRKHRHSHTFPHTETHTRPLSLSYSRPLSEFLFHLVMSVTFSKPVNDVVQVLPIFLSLSLTLSYSLLSHLSRFLPISHFLKYEENLCTFSLSAFNDLSTSISVSFSLSKTYCSSLSVDFPLSPPLCLSLSLGLFLSVALSLSLSLCLFLSVAFSLSLSLCLFLSFSFSLSLSLSLFFSVSIIFTQLDLPKCKQAPAVASSDLQLSNIRLKQLCLTLKVQIKRLSRWK